MGGKRLYYGVRTADYLVRAPPPIAVCTIPESRPEGFHRPGRLPASTECCVLLLCFRASRIAGRCGIDFHYPVRSHGLLLCTHIAPGCRTIQVRGPVRAGASR